MDWTRDAARQLYNPDDAADEQGAVLDDLVARVEALRDGMRDE